jgi:hypothetical protein
LGKILERTVFIVKVTFKKVFIIGGKRRFFFYIRNTAPLPPSQFIGVADGSEDCKKYICSFRAAVHSYQFVAQATSQATQMVKSKSMEVVHAVQGDLNEVI